MAQGFIASVNVLIACFSLWSGAATSGRQLSLAVNFTGDCATQNVTILKDVPQRIDRKGSYLFYLHGRIIENEGIRPTDPRFGVYEYEEILSTLASKGFTVISEPRPRNTDPNHYASKVVRQIDALIKAGVSPNRITVVGASKGAVITMLISTLLKNNNVNFVIMSNCNEWVDQNFRIDLKGNVLSIYDVKDEFGGSCQRFFDKATDLNRRKEVVLHIGTGHAVLYKPLKAWVDLVVEWAESSK